MNNVTIISTKHTRLSKNQAITKYLYKNVFTHEGRNIGRVIQIIFEKTEIKGFIVAKAFFFRKLFIGMEYVDKFTTNSVILKITPIILMKGMTVFDSEGKIVGKVKSVKRSDHSNSFESLVVSKGLFRKEHTLHPDQVVILKKNIKLKIEL